MAQVLPTRMFCLPSMSRTDVDSSHSCAALRPLRHTTAFNRVRNTKPAFPEKVSANVHLHQLVVEGEVRKVLSFGQKHQGFASRFCKEHLVLERCVGVGAVEI